MANSEIRNGREMVRNNMKEIGRLLSRQQYNQAIQTGIATLRIMVQTLADERGLPMSSLTDGIDMLFNEKVISRMTCENYHKIRVIGEKAAQINDSRAYNASAVYSILNQEVGFFLRGSSQAAVSGPGTRRTSQGVSSANRRRVRTESSRYPASGSSFSLTPGMIRLLLLLLLLVIVAVTISFCVRKKEPEETLPLETSPPAVTTLAETQTAALETTPAETTTAAAVLYVTTSALNVRSAPSTDGDKLATLPEGTEVEYIRAHDAQWAVISYNGAEAYVASQYLKQR